MTDNYKLDFLLDRIYNNQQISNTKTRINLPKLQIHCENRKTFFSNYYKICQELNRNENDFIKFVQKELSTGTSINGNNELVIDGTYREKNMEKIIMNYIENYVKCRMCKSLQTQINKEQRNTVLFCNKCKASTTIQLV